jgi:hypothetical protein
MSKTLYLKFLATYAVFALLCFISIATLTSSLTLSHLTREKADALYKEAALVAGSYAKEVYKGAITLDAAKSQLKAIDTYISAPIWFLNNHTGQWRTGWNHREHIVLFNHFGFD